MERNNLDLIELPLVEPLLVSWTLLHLEQDCLKRRDSVVLVLKLNSRLLLRLLLLDSNVIAFYLLL